MSCKYNCFSCGKPTNSHVFEKPFGGKVAWCHGCWLNKTVAERVQIEKGTCEHSQTSESIQPIMNSDMNVRVVTCINCGLGWIHEEDVKLIEDILGEEKVKQYKLKPRPILGNDLMDAKNDKKNEK